MQGIVWQLQFAKWQESKKKKRNLKVYEYFRRGYIKELKDHLGDKTKLPCGDVFSTKGNNLKNFQTILNVVGPIYNEKDVKKGEKVFRKTMEKILKEVTDKEAKSIAFPMMLSFNFPKDLSANMMLEILLNFIDENKKNTTLKNVLFVNLTKETKDLFIGKFNFLLQNKFFDSNANYFSQIFNYFYNTFNYIIFA